MSVSILEALENAKHNLTNPVIPAQKQIGLKQLSNAIALLEKGYDPYTEVDPLLEKHGSVSAVPDAPV